MKFSLGLLGTCAGLFGAAGVALAAAGAHLTGGSTLTTAAQFCLFHAAALVALLAVALAFRAGRGAICVSAFAIALGTLLFSGDLACRALLGVAPLRLAAPTGGVILILGWLSASVTLTRAVMQNIEA